MFIRKRIIAIIALVLVTLGTIAGLSACSGGPSAPQNATQILQNDGYTPSSAYTTALQNGIGDSSGTITSSQAGTNSGGVQAVVVFDNSADEQVGATAVQTAIGGGGISIASNGDVLTATGPVAAWASAGG